MAKEFLRPIYKDVFGQEFDYTSFDSRMEMQKMIYLLQEAGVSVGDYGFVWYKYGPYSQGLQNDILDIAYTNDCSVKYSPFAYAVICKMRDVFSATNISPYSRKEWVECIASLQYLISNIFPAGASEEDIQRDLISKKPHLRYKELNHRAFLSLERLLG